MKSFLIAEIAQAHDGSIGMAHSYIDALAETGIDSVKFQLHIAEAESSFYEPFRTKFSFQDNSRFDYWKRMEFSENHWIELKKHCDDKNIEFMASPFSNAAVDILERLNVKRYKIGSGEVSNFLLLEKITKTKKPIILSSGMSSYYELDKVVKFLKQKKANFSILQCTTSYPTNPEDWGLNIIRELKDRYNCEIGFSDHSGDIAACIAATALGASILEFHAVFDKKAFGPDATSSLTINQIKNMVSHIRNINKSQINNIDKNNVKKYHDLKMIFEKSLSVNKDVFEGDIITFDLLEAKKPKGRGIDAIDYHKILGKKINKDLNKWDFITKNDIYE